MADRTDTQIFVIGSINSDLVASVTSLPELGETIHSYEFRQYLGGKGANQAVAASLLGSKVAMIGCVGNDDAGNLALQGLEAANVEHSRVRKISDLPTGTALITVAQNGDNTIVVVPGANSSVDLSFVETIESDFKNASAVLLQLEIPDVAISKAVQIINHWRQVSSRSNPWVVFNPSPFRDSTNLLLSSVDILIVNESEAEALSGIRIKDMVGAVDAVKHLLPTLRRGGMVVLTLGEKGAIVFLDKESEFAKGLEHPELTADVIKGNNPEIMLSDVSSYLLFVPALTVQSVDSTGAGDVFTGGFVAQLTAGNSVVMALRFATTAAAITVTRAGAQSSFPNTMEVMKKLDEVAPVEIYYA